MPINKKVGISLAIALFGYVCIEFGIYLNEPRCPIAINEVPTAKYQEAHTVGPALHCYYTVEIVRPMKKRKS